MPSQFYGIEDDLGVPDRWMVGNLNLPDHYAWDDIESKSLINSVNWTAEILMPGDPLDVTLIDFGLIMTTKKFISLLPVFEIEYKEIKIKNYKSKEPYYLLVVKNAVECVDAQKSKYKLWEVNNEIRPELAGKYEYFTELKVDPKKITPLSICTLKGYEVVRVVSKDVRDKFLALKLRGINFSEV